MAAGEGGRETHTPPQPITQRRSTCARMPGKPPHSLLLLLLVVAALLCGPLQTPVAATPQEEAVLTQLKQVWSAGDNKVSRWVDSVDACNAPWPGITCALKDDITTPMRCSITNSSCLVTHLDLSNSSLTGEIPFILGGLSNLLTLDLHGNELVGEVAAQLFDGFPNLAYLDFSSNYFNDSIPKIGRPAIQYANWRHNCFSEYGACRLQPDMRGLAECERVTALALPICPSWVRQHPILLYILVGVCPFSFILLTFLAVMLCLWRRRRRRPSCQVSRSRLGSSSKIQSVECKHFAYAELEEATNNFHDNRLLGCGGFGSVYQGRLADGSYVAVKQLEKGSSQGDAEFWNEVLIIGAIQHPNVVTLRGYCKEARGAERLLVYDYMPNGSVLDSLLSSDEHLLPWSRRYSIALGTACGLEFLHEHCTPRIIHRDIKPSNILLDRNFTARVGDFGLAKVALGDQTHVTTAVVGTQGFVDPEYALTGKLTEKSDVFSFGMLLLVLVSGRHVLETQASLNATGKAQLLSWMQVLAKAEELSELVDQRLRGVYDKRQVSLCAQIALLCTRILPDLRPTMGEVRRFLDGSVEVPVAASLINSPNSSSRGSFVSECLTPSVGSCYGHSHGHGHGLGHHPHPRGGSFVSECYNLSNGSCHGGADSV